MLSHSFKEDLIKKCELICTITIAQMKSRYRKTFAGFVWVVLNPILAFVIQALIFRHILKIGIENYYVYLMAGLVPWVFLISSINMTVSTFVVNRSTLMAFKIDPWIFLVSQVLDNFINFLASYFVLIFLVDYTILFNYWLLPLFVLTTILLVIFIFFLCFFLATLNVFFRDTQYILQFVTTLAIFVTPVFYPISLLPENYQRLVHYNPLYIVLKPFQYLVWKYDLPLYFQSMTEALALLVVVSFISVLYWRRNRHAIFFRV